MACRIKANLTWKTKIIISSQYFSKKFKRINFSVYFSIQYIHIRESSKRCLIFSYFTAVFDKSVIISRQELSFNHILKECFVSKDMQIIKKSKTRFRSSFIWIAPLKILKWYCKAFRTWSSPNKHTTTILKNKAVISKG